MKLLYVVFFFTTNSPVIFLKYIFDFVLNTASSALNGVCRRKVHGKGIKTKTLHQTYVIILSRDLKQRRRRRRRQRERLKSNSLKPGPHMPPMYPRRSRRYRLGYFSDEWEHAPPATRAIPELYRWLELNFTGMPPVKTGMTMLAATSVLISEPYPRQYRRPCLSCIGGIYKPGLAKHQLCTRITLFCTFLSRRCTTTRWKYVISRFVEDGNTGQQLSFQFSWTLIQPFYTHLTHADKDVNIIQSCLNEDLLNISKWLIANKLTLNMTSTLAFAAQENASVPFFFSLCGPQKGVIVPGARSEDRGNWGHVSRPDESHAGKINAKDVEVFRNGSVYEFYRLKALIILEQANTSVVEKKRKKFRRWGYVNFHCMQMSLVMIMRIIFGDDWNDALCWSSFWSRLRLRPVLLFF